MDLRNKTILAFVSDKQRFYSNVCPNCFKICRHEFEKHHHMRHTCWFSQFDKTACKDKPCLCQHTCLHCKKVFDIYRYVDHYKECYKRFHCGVAFENLPLEKKEFLPFEPKYKCCICNFTFDNIKAYRNHKCQN